MPQQNHSSDSGHPLDAKADAPWEAAGGRVSEWDSVIHVGELG